MTNIENILNSDKNFVVLSDYFSPQERDRLVAVLEQALANVGEQAKSTQNFNDWAKIIRPTVLKEIQDSSGFFGFTDLAERFNIESFLQSYYKANS